MSTPQSDRIAELVTRVLGSHARHSSSELAVTLGVNESYVRKLRSGWRPSRVRADLLARLRLAADADASEQRDTVSPVAGSSEFYDGVLFAAQAMTETVTRLLADARAGLRSADATPSAPSIAGGLAVRRTAAREPDETATGPRSKGRAQ